MFTLLLIGLCFGAAALLWQLVQGSKSRPRSYDDSTYLPPTGHYPGPGIWWGDDDCRDASPEHHHLVPGWLDTSHHDSSDATSSDHSYDGGNHDSGSYDSGGYDGGSSFDGGSFDSGGCGGSSCD